MYSTYILQIFRAWSAHRLEKIKHVGNYHEMNEEEGVIRDMYDGVITDFDTTSEDESDY